MTIIKRVKRGKKFFIYQTDNRGRIVTITKWSSKNTVTNAKRRFKVTGSIRKGQKRTLLSISNPNYVEIIDNRKFIKQKPRREWGYQYYVVVVADGNKATGRSMQHPQDYPVQDAREEALENAIGLATNYKDDMPDFKIIDEGFVSYAKV